MSSSLYIGQVMHQRFTPFKYRFNYQVFSLRIDIDRFAEESHNLKWLSFNRFNLLSFYSSDVGPRNQQNLREWFDQLMVEHGVSERPAKVELVCMPRFLGYRFNPIVMWYAYNLNNELISVVAEVSNTFGQWHHYVLTNQGQPLQSKKLSAVANKVFHVSPFLSMECQYRFAFYQPAEKYQLGIYETEKGEPVLTATQTAKAVALNSKNILKVALKFPFISLKVIGLIHWWALKIWIKGGKFHKTPQQLADVDYGHSEMELC